MLSAYGSASSQALTSEIMLGQYPAEKLGVGRKVSLCEAVGAAVPYAAASLEGLSSISSLGLMNYPVGAWPGWRQPERPDVQLNLMVRCPPSPSICAACSELLAAVCLAVQRVARYFSSQSWGKHMKDVSMQCGLLHGCVSTMWGGVGTAAAHLVIKVRESTRCQSLRCWGHSSRHHD